MEGKGRILFDGIVVISYNPLQFTREDALSIYLDMGIKFPEELSQKEIIRIHLDHSNKNRTFHRKGDGRSRGGESEFSISGPADKLKPSDEPVAIMPELKAVTDPVTLSTPFLNSDKRWESVGLTSAPLFLGSALKEKGYSVRLDNLSLPAANRKTTVYADTGLTGFTLFEDVFVPFKNFLQKFPPPSSVITAAGGPLVTLNPLGALYHLPEINLFVRGEGESVFPALLEALNQGNIDSLLIHRGFAFQGEGLILFGRYSRTNTLRDMDKLVFHFDYTDKKHLTRGLEMNFSRGCKNSCVFCSKIQGKSYRTLPEKNIHQLLESFSERLEQMDIRGEESKTININDDDLLQDSQYAHSVFRILRKYGFRIWGIQSSITSFFHDPETLREEALDLISDSDLYFGGKPLLWLGTDSFLPGRNRRLGKPMAGDPAFSRLISEFEMRNIDNYHYWITTDHQSNWEEVVKELIMICGLTMKYSRFSILPHAPFLIPYPSTPVFRQIIRSEKYRSRIQYRKIFKGIHPLFQLELVERVETGFSALNRMLRNEELPGQKGFFDLLKGGEFREALMCVYSFIREERITGQNQFDSQTLEGIRRAEEMIDHFITKII